MSINANWFPNARTARHTLITKTIAFTAVAANRTLIGFGADTPNGAWFDGIYTPKLTAYDSAYRIWSNPGTSTPLSLVNLKDAEKDFFHVYRKFYKMVKASSLVSDALLEAMGFPPRPSGNYTHHPVDRAFIDLTIKPLGNMVISVTVANRDTGISPIPYYINGAVIYYAVSDTPVTSHAALPHFRLATRSHTELVFDSEQRGKKVYLAARWQNRRGELGPWSEIVSAVVP